VKTSLLLLQCLIACILSNVYMHRLNQILWHASISPIEIPEGKFAGKNIQKICSFHFQRDQQLQLIVE
jgi:hypothetical protein